MSHIIEKLVVELPFFYEKNFQNVLLRRLEDFLENKLEKILDDFFPESTSKEYEVEFLQIDSKIDIKYVEEYFGNDFREKFLVDFEKKIIESLANINKEGISIKKVYEKQLLEFFINGFFPDHGDNLNRIYEKLFNISEDSIFYLWSFFSVGKKYLERFVFQIAPNLLSRTFFLLSKNILENEIKFLEKASLVNFLEKKNKSIREQEFTIEIFQNIIYNNSIEDCLKKFEKHFENRYSENFFISQKSWDNSDLLKKEVKTSFKSQKIENFGEKNISLQKKEDLFFNNGLKEKLTEDFVENRLRERHFDIVDFFLSTNFLIKNFRVRHEFLLKSLVFCNNKYSVESYKKFCEEILIQEKKLEGFKAVGLNSSKNFSKSLDFFFVAIDCIKKDYYPEIAIELRNFLRSYRLQISFEELDKLRNLIFRIVGLGLREKVFSKISQKNFSRIFQNILFLYSYSPTVFFNFCKNLSTSFPFEIFGKENFEKIFSFMKNFLESSTFDFSDNLYKKKFEKKKLKVEEENFLQIEEDQQIFLKLVGCLPKYFFENENITNLSLLFCEKKSVYMVKAFLQSLCRIAPDIPFKFLEKIAWKIISKENFFSESFFHCISKILKVKKEFLINYLLYDMKFEFLCFEKEKISEFSSCKLVENIFHVRSKISENLKNKFPKFFDFLNSFQENSFLLTPAKILEIKDEIFFKKSYSKEELKQIFFHSFFLERRISDLPIELQNIFKEIIWIIFPKFLKSIKEHMQKKLLIGSNKLEFLLAEIAVEYMIISSKSLENERIDKFFFENFFIKKIESKISKESILKEKRLLYKEMAEVELERTQYIANGCLVFFWPFVIELFSYLGFWKDDKFVEESSISNAAHVLNFVCTGSFAGSDWHMGIPKLLCNFDPFVPIYGSYNSILGPLPDWLKENYIFWESFLEKNSPPPIEIAIYEELKTVQNICNKWVDSCLDRWVELKILENFEKFEKKREAIREYLLNRSSTLRIHLEKESTNWTLKISQEMFDSLDIVPFWLKEEGLIFLKNFYNISLNWL